MRGLQLLTLNPVNQSLGTQRHIVDSFTTILGVPIIAAKTPYVRGTMRFYFKHKIDLWYSSLPCC